MHGSGMTMSNGLAFLRPIQHRTAYVHTYRPTLPTSRAHAMYGRLDSMASMAWSVQPQQAFPSEGDTRLYL